MVKPIVYKSISPFSLNFIWILLIECFRITYMYYTFPSFLYYSDTEILDHHLDPDVAKEVLLIYLFSRLLISTFSRMNVSLR